MGFHQKPCGLLNVDGYYDPLLTMVDHAVAEAFVRPSHRSLILAETEGDRLLGKLVAYTPIAEQKWLDRGQT